MPKRVCLYLHTHWDREWYRSFESYRYRLSRTLLSILDFLDADPQHEFLLDGQTVVLEDFLAVHPNEAERLRAGIASGRLQVGPWYVLPDEFLVSGEAIIRNLQLGTRQARALGQDSFCGYLPDMFGHVGQMPQILAQSDLSPALLWRGLQPESALFEWEALDGTRLPTVHLTKGYYQDAWHREEVDWELFESFLEPIAQATPDKAPLLMPLGADHMGLPPELPARIQAAQERYRDYAFELKSLPDYLSQLPAEAFAQGPRQRGELRQPDGAYVLPGVWSTRRYLKQANAALQNRLERELEPLLVLQFLSGFAVERPLLEQAWKYLLQNHPHDSICGCSIDEVHQDMLPRFRWAHELADELQATAFRSWGGQRLGNQPGTRLNCWNPAAQPFAGWVETEILRPPAPPHQAEKPEAKDKPASIESETFQLQGADAQLYPYHLLSQEEGEIFLAEPEVLPHWQDVRRSRIRFWVEIPPLSCVSLQIVKGDNPTPPSQSALPAQNPGIENEYCRILFDKGRLRLFGKEEHTWRLLAEGHVFISEGDAGDSYNYSPPREDAQVLLEGSRFERFEFPGGQGLRLHYQGFVPAGLSEDRSRRSGLNRPLQIESEVRVFQGDPQIYFDTSLHNQSNDHRLRLIWKSPYKQFKCRSSTALGAIERQYKPPAEIQVPKGQERVVDEFPFDEWIHVLAPDDGGWAWHSEGLHEASICRFEGQAALSLTLLRCVGWLSRDDLQTRGGGAGPRMPTPEAQCHGTHRYHYRMSLTGNDIDRALRALSPARSPVQVFQGESPQLLQLFELEAGSLHLSACTLSQDGQAIIVRWVNESEAAAPLRIAPRFDCQRVSITTPLEHTERELLETPCVEQPILYTLNKAEILTLKFYPNSADALVKSPHSVL